jgi:GT2 family glycosyltransferase
MTNHNVSVIIPAWNGAQELPACLDALLAQTHDKTHGGCEILVVDNASVDGSGDLVAARYPQVRLIRNARNLGFAGGCNVGLELAQGEVLVLLNQDTEVHPGWLAALVTVLDADPTIGIAGSKALYPNGAIQHAGGVVDLQGSGSHRGYRQPDNGQFDDLADVDYVTGASLALRRAVYAQIGGFDEGFEVAYSEDVDFCLRAQAAGWRVVYAPASVLVHKEQSTAAAPGYDAMVLQHRNRLRVVAKHWPQTRLREEFLPAERAWLEGLEPGGERLIAAVHQAYLLHLLALGEMARWRQRILNEPPESITTLAQVLLALRTVYPLGPIGRLAPAGPAAGAGSAGATLAELASLAVIREQPFRSNVPLLGRWIAAFRRGWNRMSTEWYVKPMIAQQTRFNGAVIAALQQDQTLQQRLAEVIAEYLAGQAREISTLGQELTDLKARVQVDDPSIRGDQEQ